MTLCNLIALWFSSYVNSSFLCTLMNTKTSMVCRMTKKHVWKLLGMSFCRDKACRMHNVANVWCINSFIFHWFQLQAIHRKEATGIEEKWLFMKRACLINLQTSDNVWRLCMYSSKYMYMVLIYPQNEEEILSEILMYGFSIGHRF